MKVPTREHLLGAGLRCQMAEVDAKAIQGHFIKHPMGMGTLYGRSVAKRRRLWNEEGWDETEPPVLSLQRRRELSAHIQNMKISGNSCMVDRLHKEDYGGEAIKGAIACYECPKSLATICNKAARAEVTAYLAFVDTALSALGEGDAAVVSHKELTTRALGNLRNVAWFDDLTVLSIRLRERNDGSRQPIARLSSTSGVRSEFYLNGNHHLKWRTTYRERPEGLAAKYRLLMEESLPHGVSDIPLSDEVLVPRLWWEKQ